MKMIYLSGKITNNPDYLSQFTAAHERLKHNYPHDFIVNPVELCDEGWSWIRCMIHCIRALVHCDIIVLINGWQYSRGARIERRVAKLLGIDIHSIIIYDDGQTRLFPFEI